MTCQAKKHKPKNVCSLSAKTLSPAQSVGTDKPRATRVAKKIKTKKIWGAKKMQAALQKICNLACKKNMQSLLQKISGSKKNREQKKSRQKKSNLRCKKYATLIAKNMESKKLWRAKNYGEQKKRVQANLRILQYCLRVVFARQIAGVARYVADVPDTPTFLHILPPAHTASPKIRASKKIPFMLLTACPTLKLFI